MIESKEVLVELEDQLNSAGYVTRVEDTDGLEMLRVVIDELGQDKNGSVLMELCFIPMEAEEIPEDLNIFQIFTTIEKDIPEEKLSGILAELNKINIDCILGGFQIFEEQMQLYHKYVCIARGTKAAELLNTIQPAMNWIVATIQEGYEELIGVCRQ